MKPWWKSRTIWVNAAAGIASAGAAVTWPDIFADAPKWVTALLGMVWCGANVALRFATTDEICLRQIREGEQ